MSRRTKKSMKTITTSSYTTSLQYISDRFRQIKSLGLLKQAVDQKQVPFITLSSCDGQRIPKKLPSVIQEMAF